MRMLNRLLILTGTIGLLGSCGASEGGKADIADSSADTRVIEDITEIHIGPPDYGPGDTGDVRIPDDADVDRVFPDLDVGEVPDQTGPTGCTKDSDCRDAAAGFGPCRLAMCDKHQGTCVPVQSPVGSICDDGNLCTERTTCSAMGECLGRAVVCDDGNLCTTDVCIPSSGCTYESNSHVCSDGNACTTGDRCADGVCVGEYGPQCACTADEDCVAFDDNDRCNGKVQCLFNVCRIPASSVVHCDAGQNSSCRKNLCQPESGQCSMTSLGNGHPCDDGDACTMGDVCYEGQCVGAAPKPCNDGNPCTLGSCEPATGCVQEYNQYPCEDRDTCTINDQCRHGTCYPGTGNQCTAQTCFPKWTLQCGMSDQWSTDLAGTSNHVTRYPGVERVFDGPEFTYSFVAPFDGRVTLRLQPGDGVAVWAMVLEGRGRGCEPANLRFVTEGIGSFDVFQGQTYYLVVDSPVGDGGAYTLSLECQPLTEFNCGDGLDDDGDGATDCDDPDCHGDAACPAPFCQAAWVLTCGSKAFGATYGPGSTVAVESYSDPILGRGCVDNLWSYPGPEMAYRFDAPASFDISVQLTRESALTDLLILREEGQGCNPMSCIAWGQQKVTFPVEGGKTYYFVVDGYQGAMGAFQIQVTCPTHIETHCSDGVDNDLDTKVDCDDPDCAQATDCIGNCRPVRTVDCGHVEAYSNFGLGHTKAIKQYGGCTNYSFPGPEMAYRLLLDHPAEVTARLELKTASLDLMVIPDHMCNPAQCLAHGLSEVTFSAEANRAYNIVVDGYVEDPLGTYLFRLDCDSPVESDCTDGVDNDGDGLTDCADEADCSQSADCPRCVAKHSIQCGDVDTWNNTGVDATNIISSYGCAAGRYDGPEFAYFFLPDTTGQVTVSLDSTEWDLDILILRDNGYGCNPASCVAWGTRTVSFEALKGVKYFFVVDGYGARPMAMGPSFGTSEYRIDVVCD